MFYFFPYFDPRAKTYIVCDFNVNLWLHYNSAPAENFSNQMIFSSDNYSSF